MRADRPDGGRRVETKFFAFFDETYMESVYTDANEPFPLPAGDGQGEGDAEKFL
jgi:hypothetical protein